MGGLRVFWRDLGVANAVWVGCRGDLGFLGVPGVPVPHSPRVLLLQGYPKGVSPDYLQY